MKNSYANGGGWPNSGGKINAAQQRSSNNNNRGMYGAGRDRSGMAGGGRTNDLVNNNNGENKDPVRVIISSFLLLSGYARELYIFSYKIWTFNIFVLVLTFNHPMNRLKI